MEPLPLAANSSAPPSVYETHAAAVDAYADDLPAEVLPGRKILAWRQRLLRGRGHQVIDPDDSAGLRPWALLLVPKVYDRVCVRERVGVVRGEIRYCAHGIVSG